MAYYLERTGLGLYTLGPKDINRVKVLPFELVFNLPVFGSFFVNCTLLLERGEEGTSIFLVVNLAAQGQRHDGVQAKGQGVVGSPMA